ncbi:4a-hydroxytetrahydrobiopterin dehydratase [Mycobacterium sp. CBMA271]|uniref:4a-hydroxytetrahydrobiopterin dehydratase n=1 Tax=unclassified Mycobacteroides TaxID=2618759 RepID=UPI0012DE1B36|nr:MULTISPECIES: 4a-hydroxytetrahydrobiopterin dehydratase [unclassified Mycobacteroides]MUM16641.1 4a-hydroxytetrahydrobiopterin dehydratase [Mycobacteroides sp. CBMA 326]MUM22049.1 4a-hydroxytetrahydrobiopterin dehydratase [Mycobacteroides sp. CBMA 271]
MALLTDDQINAALSGLSGWTRDGDTLRRAITFSAFLDGVAAVQRIAVHAESVDHHPDIDIRWRTVTFALSTHSEGGLTEKDVALAQAIDSEVGS